MKVGHAHRFGGIELPFFDCRKGSAENLAAVDRGQQTQCGNGDPYHVESSEPQRPIHGFRPNIKLFGSDQVQSENDQYHRNAFQQSDHHLEKLAQSFDAIKSDQRYP
ncbi:hypothetical protein SDC9_153116 [bioreactor metagenome]|uniref:Uncharacterized protein n=1 Tax=bioreactor metagenome TaxID=1076179 RepID=A0A645EXA2_9ZZZZ